MSMSQATSLMGGKLATFGFGCHINLPEPHEGPLSLTNIQETTIFHGKNYGFL